MNGYKVILFYNYTNIENPENLMKETRQLCQKLNLKGRIIIASEGINATVEGLEKDIESYCQKLLKDPRFKDTHIKISDGIGNAFPKLSVKVRPEIVASGLDDLDPNQISGKYVTPEKLHEWIVERKEFYIVDMRNDYEQKVGFFENSLLPGMESFRDLPKILPKLQDLKDQTIVTVCTGGVRCEKASGFLIKNGFKNVYQLYGGIVSYMEKYPGEHFKGVLYVFDNRLVMGFNTDSNREIVGRCVSCGNFSENYINCRDNLCHRHFICCENCLDINGQALCPMGCKDYLNPPCSLMDL